MEQDLIAYLLATAGVTGLVSTRIWWGIRPQQEQGMPAIVLHRIGGAPAYHLSGDSGLTESRVQIDCWAETPDSAQAVRDAVRTALSGAKFDSIQGCFLESEFHSFEAQGPEAPERFHRVSLDLLIWHMV